MKTQLVDQRVGSEDAERRRYIWTSPERCEWKGDYGMQLEGRLQIIEGKRSGRGNAFVGREEEICELIKSWTPMKGDS